MAHSQQKHRGAMRHGTGALLCFQPCECHRNNEENGAAMRSVAAHEAHNRWSKRQSSETYLWALKIKNKKRQVCFLLGSWKEDCDGCRVLKLHFHNFCVSVCVGVFWQLEYLEPTQAGLQNRSRVCISNGQIKTNHTVVYTYSSNFWDTLNICGTTGLAIQKCCH